MLHKHHVVVVSLRKPSHLERCTFLLTSMFAGITSNTKRHVDYLKVIFHNRTPLNLPISYKIDHTLCVCPTLIENYKCAQYKWDYWCLCVCLFYPGESMILICVMLGREGGGGSLYQVSSSPTEQETHPNTLYISIYHTVVRPKSQSKARVSNKKAKTTLYLKSKKKWRDKMIKQTNRNNLYFTCLQT